MKTVKKQLSELSFNIHIGTIVSGEIIKDYLTLLELEYSPKELNDKYMVNLCKDIQKKISTVLKNVSRELVNERTEDAVKEVIEWNFNLIYDSLALPMKDQQRVYSLIKKIKKESNGN